MNLRLCYLELCRSHTARPSVLPPCASQPASQYLRAILISRTQNETLEDGDADDRLPALRDILPPQILGATGTFPMSLMSGPHVQLPKDTLESMYWYLPQAAEAAALRDVYYQYAAWMYVPGPRYASPLLTAKFWRLYSRYNPIPLDQFNEEVYCPFYEVGPQNFEDPLLGHRLSVLFMVLAIGSQVDPNLPPHNINAEK